MGRDSLCAPALAKTDRFENIRSIFWFSCWSHLRRDRH